MLATSDLGPGTCDLGLANEAWDLGLETYDLALSPHTDLDSRLLRRLDSGFWVPRRRRKERVPYRTLSWP